VEEALASELEGTALMVHHEEREALASRLHLRDDLSFPWPAAQAADTGHRHETQSAIDPLGVIVLVCHYDERTGPCQSLACDLAQQLTTEPRFRHSACVRTS
jgi:hypothetical protein